MIIEDNKYSNKNDKENNIKLEEDTHELTEEHILGISENLQAMERSLLERAFLCLEDCYFGKAEDLLERVLNINPQNSKAYIGKLMVDLKINYEKDIPLASKSFSENRNYKRAVQFAKNDYLDTITNYNKLVLERIINEPKERIYQNAMYSKFVLKLSEFEYKDIANQLRGISEYKDSEALASEFDNIANDLIIKKQEKYYTEAEGFLKIDNIKYASLNYFLAGNFKKSHDIYDLCSLISAGRYQTVFINKNAVTTTSQGLPCLKVFGIDPSSSNLSIDDIFGDFFGGTYSDNYRVCYKGMAQFNFHESYSLELLDSLRTVSSGYNHIVILDKYGLVVTNGENKDGQCNTQDWRDIVLIAAGSNFTMGLKKDGTVVATGLNDKGQCSIEQWKNIVEVSAGSNHSLGINEVGTVLATGSNDKGECNVEGWTNIILVSAGSGFSIGLKKDGTVVATGINDKGQCDVKEWRDIISLSAGYKHTLGLKQNGTVVATGLNDDFQCNTKEWKDIVAISAGTDHSIGLKKDGTLIAVGSNGNGQCNLGGIKLFKDIDSEKCISDFEVIKLKILELEKPVLEKEELEKKLKEKENKLSSFKPFLFGAKAIEKKDVINDIAKIKGELKNVYRIIANIRTTIEDMQW